MKNILKWFLIIAVFVLFFWLIYTNNKSLWGWLGGLSVLIIASIPFWDSFIKLIIKIFPKTRQYLDKTYNAIVFIDELIDKFLEEHGKNMEETCKICDKLYVLDNLLNKIRIEFEQTEIGQKISWEQIAPKVTEITKQKINESPLEINFDLEKKKFLGRINIPF